MLSSRIHCWLIHPPSGSDISLRSTMEENRGPIGICSTRYGQRRSLAAVGRETFKLASRGGQTEIYGGGKNAPTDTPRRAPYLVCCPRSKCLRKRPRCPRGRKVTDRPTPQIRWCAFGGSARDRFIRVVCPSVRPAGHFLINLSSVHNRNIDIRRPHSAPMIRPHIWPHYLVPNLEPIMQPTLRTVPLGEGGSSIPCGRRMRMVRAPQFRFARASRRVQSVAFPAHPPLQRSQYRRISSIRRCTSCRWLWSND